MDDTTESEYIAHMFHASFVAPFVVTATAALHALELLDLCCILHVNSCNVLFVHCIGVKIDKFNVIQFLTFAGWINNS